VTIRVDNNRSGNVPLAPRGKSVRTGCPESRAKVERPGRAYSASSEQRDPSIRRRPTAGWRIDRRPLRQFVVVGDGCSYAKKRKDGKSHGLWTDNRAHGTSALLNS